jgi:hypothetical protein
MENLNEQIKRSTMGLQGFQPVDPALSSYKSTQKCPTSRIVLFTVIIGVLSIIVNIISGAIVLNLPILVFFTQPMLLLSYFLAGCLMFGIVFQIFNINCATKISQ